MSTAELAQKVVSIIHPSAPAIWDLLAFEMAYQARVAADRIRFAIGQIDKPARNSDQLREASLQLLDALDRLESAEQRFQSGWRGHGRKESSADSNRAKDGNQPFFE
jgi:uncharacterized protein YukE